MTDITKNQAQPVEYVDNKEFSEKVFEYTQQVKACRESGEPKPIVTDYIARCFIKIAEGLARSSNFSQYTYKDEMVSDAIESCLKAVGNFDPEKETRTGKPNAFGYFTQIAYYAFVNRLNKERRQREIRERIIEQSNIEDFMINSEDGASQNLFEEIGLNHMTLSRSNYSDEGSDNF